MNRFIFLILFLIAPLCARGSESALRLPDGVMPTLGCWFWQVPEFQPGGYKAFIDLVQRHSPYNFLTASLRIPEKELTDADVHAQIEAAAIYAREQGVPLVMDLDVRLARRAFQAAHPDELQQMLLLHEVDLSPSHGAEVVVRSLDLSDHYTHRTTHYIPLAGELLRVYAYTRDEAGIEAKTLRDITATCRVLAATKDSVVVRIAESGDATRACVMAAFTHLTPDVFAPHLIEFQRDILRRYADAPLAGAAKDEWGFPPCYDGDPQKRQFWFSRHRARAYAERTGGRDLTADCLLMSFGIKGREAQRRMAVNHFMEMSWQRNGELENDFYHTVKEVFGRDAIVATHPTWWPYPDLREFKKNGLDWWVATRDWAQTDETTPFAVRTALAKKWDSPVWYNMFYSKSKEDYERAVWRYALAGGRVNYHRPWPSTGLWEARKTLLRGDLMRAESRVRLLNFISNSPPDSPVAVVFGHACAMNWAGPAYNDVGMALADEFWLRGFPADLIPGSEIDNGSLVVDDEGWVRYGAQRYAAVILYHPEFEKPSTAAFFNRAATGPTSLFRLGQWTQDFDARPFDGDAALPNSMLVGSDVESLAADVVTALQRKNVAPQTAATAELRGFGHTSASPPTSGFCRLIDGTLIQIAGTDSVAGDRIRSTVNIDGVQVTFDAIGVAAVRLDDRGRVQALAAGGLQYFRAGSFELKFDRRVDLALWLNEKGKWRGVLQGWSGDVPASLRAVTDDWLRLKVPTPVAE